MIYTYKVPESQGYSWCKVRVVYFPNWDPALWMMNCIEMR